MRTKLKRIIFICLSVLIIVGGLLIAYGFHEINKLHNISEKIFTKNEENFKKNPNVIEGLLLMRKNWEREKFDKTVFYAEYCIKVGVDSTNQGWMVHMLMANSYLKLGNKKNACTQVNIAMKLAQRDQVSFENLKEYGLQDVVNSCNMKSLGQP